MISCIYIYNRIWNCDLALKNRWLLNSWWFLGTRFYEYIGFRAWWKRKKSHWMRFQKHRQMPLSPGWRIGNWDCFAVVFFCWRQLELGTVDGGGTFHAVVSASGVLISVPLGVEIDQPGDGMEKWCNTPGIIGVGECHSVMGSNFVSWPEKGTAPILQYINVHNFGSPPLLSCWSKPFPRCSW